MVEHILLVGPEPPPIGGIAAHMASLARALVLLGVRTTRVDPRHRLRFVTDLGRAGLGGDLVHLHVCGHNRSSYGLLGACLAATPARPAMVTLHSGMCAAFLARVTRTGRRTIAGLLHRASAVVCVSEPVAEAVRALGVEPRIASPYLNAGLRVGRLPARVAAASLSGERLITAAVAPGSEYGADTLVAGFAHVAAHVHDVTLVVFGPGGADREVARRLQARGLGERVMPLGELPAATAQATLQASDVVVRPTLADGDAMTVREARALGRPVVASAVAPRPPGTLLFPAGDWRALAAAVLAALRLPAPPAALDDGLAPLVSLYAGLEVAACAVSPVA